jgi:hypothetical protein
MRGSRARARHHAGVTTTLQFECPRCRQPTEERWFGPCTTCRDQLRATMGNEPHAVEAADYEPKMNVTPNHVATKD